MATGTFLYSSLPGAQVEDFLLVPRSSPFLGGGSDAVALLVVESASHALPPVPGALSGRELRALTFPPIRSTGGRDGERKEYGTGADAFVPMTAAPQMASASPMPASSSGWGFSSPALGSAPTPEALRSLPPMIGSEGFGEFRLPATFWAGSHTLLGCHLVDVPRESFSQLRKWDAGCADGWDGMSRLPLDGGRAQATTTGAHAPNLRTLKVRLTSPSRGGRGSSLLTGAPSLRSAREEPPARQLAPGRDGSLL
jgi:syntaxin-binding protein 5